MGRRLTIIIVLLVGGAAAASWTLSRWRQESSAQDLAAYIQQLNSANPLIRLRSAIGVLEIDPTHPDAELIGAEALIELSRFPEAKRVLLELEEKSRHTQRHAQVLLLHARACLEEAAGLVAAGTPQSVEVAAARVEPLLAEADQIFDSLKADPLTDADVAKLRAQSAYLQTAMLRLKLQSHQSAFAAAEAVGFESDQTRKIKATTAKLNHQIQQRQQTLIDLCRQAVQLDPQDADTKRLLFLMWVDDRSFDRARIAAMDVARVSPLDASLAGKIANVLLDLESRYQQQTTTRDIQIAAQLLQRDDLTNTDHIDYRIAIARLALLDGQPEQAQQLTQQVLARFPGHPRAMCLLALALVDQGQPKHAVDLLNRLKMRVHSAEIYYTLGLALIDTGQADQGREMLRQCIEIEPNYLPAVVKLAESLAESGFIIEAEPEIIAAVELNPDHPWVLKLRLHLLAAQMEYATFSAVFAKQIPPDLSVWQWQHVALVSAMVLGDTNLVAELSEQLTTHGVDNLLAIAVHCWRRANPENRIDVAAVTMRVILERLDADPLARPNPPTVPVIALWDNDATQKQQSLLRRPCFLEQPYDQTLALIESALERWDNQPALLDLAARLCIWTNQRNRASEYLSRLVDSGNTMSPTAQAMLTAYLDSGGPQALLPLVPQDPPDTNNTDTPTLRMLALAATLNKEDRQATQAALADLLERVSWSEQPLLVVMQDALDRGSPEQAQQWIAFAQDINPRIALLARAMLDIVSGQPFDALHNLKTFLRNEERASEIGQIATEALARTSLQLGQEDVAVVMFENMALSNHDEKQAMRLASVDILLAKHRIKEAVASLTVMLNDKDLAPRWRDAVLVRASYAMRPDQFQALLDKLLKSQEQDPLLMLYHAQSLADEGDLAQASRLFDDVLETHPDAPRALMAVAKLAVRQGDLEQARRLFRWLINQGGRAGQAAKKELDQLNQDATQETGFTVGSMQ